MPREKTKGMTIKAQGSTGKKITVIRVLIDIPPLYLFKFRYRDRMMNYTFKNLFYYMHYIFNLPIHLFWKRLPDDANLKEGADSIEGLTRQAEKKAEETQELIQQV